MRSDQIDPVPADRKRRHVLVVEDEPVLREMLCENLHLAGYQPEAAADGLEAWNLLRQDTRRISTVLLDRRIPELDGLEVLQRIKSDPDLAHLPVIMQTAMTEPAEILEGLQAGAYYYLTKPFTAETLLAIVDTAVGDWEFACALQREASRANRTLRHLQRAEFLFRSPLEAQDIAALLSHACPHPEHVIIGLTELMLNAIEHGNLGITYREKTLLIDHGRWEEELRIRLDMPAYRERRASVAVERDEGEIRFRITDQGDGFDWHPYLEIDPERAFDNHGRGIAMARMLSFDRLEYMGQGNSVLAVVDRGRWPDAADRNSIPELRTGDGGM